MQNKYIRSTHGFQLYCIHALSDHSMCSVCLQYCFRAEKSIVSFCVVASPFLIKCTTTTYTREHGTAVSSVNSFRCTTSLTHCLCSEGSCYFKSSWNRYGGVACRADILGKPSARAPFEIAQSNLAIDFPSIQC